MVGIALGELGRDLVGQVVLLVLAFPIAPILAQRVLQRAVGDHAHPAAAVLHLGDEQQVAAGRVLFEQILERLAQRALVARAAVADDPLNFGVVLLDQLDGHGILSG